MSKRFEDMKKQTAKNKDKLSKCHICGNEARIVKDRNILNQMDFWSVVCCSSCCECTGAYKTVKEAIEAWNNINKRYGVEVE